VRSAGFEPAIPASEVPQTCVLDSAATSDDIVLQIAMRIRRQIGPDNFGAINLTIKTLKHSA